MMEKWCTRSNGKTTVNPRGNQKAMRMCQRQSVGTRWMWNQDASVYVMWLKVTHAKWKESEMTRRYPIVSTDVDIEDPSTLSKHQSAIAEELDKAKPRDTVLLPLLNSTYGERRLYIVNNSSSVKDIKTRYACSKHVVADFWCFEKRLLICTIRITKVSCY